MRYIVRGFAPGRWGVYDSNTKDFVKNPETNRKRLFYIKRNAKELADKLKKEQERAQA